MSTPPGISRSFPLLTLAMAVPLVAILAFIAYDRYVKDDAPSDGWWTYRSERQGYELRFPPDWRIIYEAESLDQQGARQTVIVSPTQPSSPGVWPLPHVFAAVNFQGDWCVSTLGVTTTAIEVGGIKGEEHVCWLKGPVADNCTPKPRCIDVPWGIMREFKRSDRSFWIFSDVDVSLDENAAAAYETTRKIIQSFRFVD